MLFASERQHARTIKIPYNFQGLHYASQLFEGMKAYRGVDNKIRLFRPEMNMQRMRKTAKRAALPVSCQFNYLELFCQSPEKLSQDFED